MIMIRELNNSKYMVEKAHYDEVLMDLDLSDEDEAGTNDNNTFASAIVGESAANDVQISLKHII